jgi:hypothetical protein
MKKELLAYRKRNGLCNGNLKCDCRAELIKWARGEIKEYQKFIKNLTNKTLKLTKVEDRKTRKEL